MKIFYFAPMTMRRTLCFEEHPFGPLLRAIKFVRHLFIFNCIIIDAFTRLLSPSPLFAEYLHAQVRTAGNTSGRTHNFMALKTRRKRDAFGGYCDATPGGHAENILSRYWRDILRIFKTKLD